MVSKSKSWSFGVPLVVQIPFEKVFGTPFHISWGSACRVQTPSHRVFVGCFFGWLGSIDDIYALNKIDVSCSKYAPVFDEFSPQSLVRDIWKFPEINWVVVSNIFYFYPYLGKIPMLTNIFQRGWNHQPVNVCFSTENRVGRIGSQDWLIGLTEDSWQFPCKRTVYWMDSLMYLDVPGS